MILKKDISNFEETNTYVYLSSMTNDVNEVIEKRGLEYQCGENGENLSGGECQRIAIARSYLCGTPILLFDEATSALDYQTARKVMANLMMYKDETVIAITHTLEKEILAQCDLIVAVDKGKIIEKGGFNDLISRGGFFYSLYKNEIKATHQ